MQPYYQNKLGTLYQGDCRNILFNIDADVVVTDPVWPNAPAGQLQGSDDPFSLFREMIQQVKPRRFVIIMRFDSDPRFLSAIPAEYPFFRSIQLPYVIPGYIGRKLGGDEIAYWFGEPIKYAPGRRCIPGRAPSAQPNSRPPNGHPCSRAQMHFDWLIKWCSDEDETVVDPFLGSGTTAVACKKHNRRWIGIEIERKYCDLTIQRLQQQPKSLMSMMEETT